MTNTRRGPGSALITLLLFIAIPLAEAWLLFTVGRNIGVLPTIALIIIVAIIGTLMIRREGPRAWRAITEAVAHGKVPSKELMDGALVLAGGILLLLPGFITDTLGVVFLLPVTRPVARRILAWFIGRRNVQFNYVGNPQQFRASDQPPTGSRPSQANTGFGGDVIDGEVVIDDSSNGEQPTGEHPNDDNPGSAPDSRS